MCKVQRPSRIWLNKVGAKTLYPTFFWNWSNQHNKALTINFGVLGVFSIKQNRVSNYWHLALKFFVSIFLKVWEKSISQKNLQFCLSNPQLCLKWIMDSRLIRLPKCYLRINLNKIHLQKHDNPFFATFDNVLGAFQKYVSSFLATRWVKHRENSVDG